MKVNEIMSKDPVTLTTQATAVEAAQKMKEADIGCVVIVDEDGRTCGLVTDRDLALRCLAAEEGDPRKMKLGDFCTRDLNGIGMDEDLDHAIALMRSTRVRRLPVMDNGTTVGVVSLGDLAIVRDPQSVLGQISAASPNN